MLRQQHPSRDNSARSRHPTFFHHEKAHQAIIENEFWYGDGEPSFRDSFTAKKTAERQDTLIDILVRAGDREGDSQNELIGLSCLALADKLEQCRPGRRCGSLACPLCARAFQKAKVAGQKVLIADLKKTRPRKALVMATVIPLQIKIRPDRLHVLHLAQRNRWFKGRLLMAGFDRVMFGSADLSWEDGFYQLHWHIGMWTGNCQRLTERLKLLFPGKMPYDRPVEVTKCWDTGFLAYKDKGIKLPDLLRRNRTHLPELMLMLDRTEPLDLMVLMKLRLSAQDGALSFKAIE